MAGETSDPKTPSPKKSSSRSARLNPIRTSGHGLDPTAAEFDLPLVGNDHVGAPDAGGSTPASEVFSQSDGAAQQGNADPAPLQQQLSPSTPPTATGPRTPPPPRSGRKSPFLGARSRVQSPTITVEVARRQVAALFHSDEDNDEDEDGVGARKSPDPGARAAKRIESSNEAEAELYDKCVELQSENAELKKAYDQAKEDFIKLQQQNKTLEKNNEDFQKQILQHKEDEERKAEESKKKQRALGGKDLESENETLQAELANALSDLKEAHDKANKLQGVNDELSAEKDALHEQIDQLHQTIATTQEEAKEHSEAQQALNNINSRFEFTFRGLGPNLSLPQYLDEVDRLQQTNRTRRDESQHSTASDFAEPKIGLQRQLTNRQVSGTSVADELTGLDESGSEAGDESASEGDDDGYDDDPTLTAAGDDDAFKPFWEEDDNHSNSARTNGSQPSGSDSTDDPFAGVEGGVDALLQNIGGIQGPPVITHSDEAPQPIGDPAVPGQAEKAGEDELFNEWEHKLVQTPAVEGLERITDPLPTVTTEEIEPVRAQLALQAQQIAEFATEIKASQDEISSLRAHHITLKSQKDAERMTETLHLRKEIESLRAQLARQTQQATDFAREMKTSRDEIASLRAHHTTLQSQKDAERTTEAVRLGEEIESLRAQLARQTQQATDSGTEKAELKEEIGRLQLHIALQAPIARERTAEIETLQRDLKALRERLATATAQLDHRPPPPPPPPARIIRQPPPPSSWKELWNLIPRDVRRSIWAYAVLMLSLLVLVTALQVYEKYVWWWANTHQHQHLPGRLGQVWYSAMVQLTAEGSGSAGGGGAGLLGWVAWCVPFLWWDVLVGGGG
ncbi:hypothetical protein KC361_g3848 [Hortaea werneckii]|nr:hypothetical protein KC361_g3848 [Hortaea werneckii]KAI7511158.1 hypothetical protein KC347_g3593 [Hortaea werneckii]